MKRLVYIFFYSSHIRFANNYVNALCSAYNKPYNKRSASMRLIYMVIEFTVKFIGGSYGTKSEIENETDNKHATFCYRYSELQILCVNPLIDNSLCTFIFIDLPKFYINTNERLNWKNIYDS